MPDFIQFFLFVGFVGLMFILRLDARRFGTAEWDTQAGPLSAWLARVTWYAAGLALAMLAFALHPAPVSELHLVLAPDRGEALFVGILYGAGGTAVAFVIAFLQAGGLQLPHPGRYPGGILSSVGTAFFDEFLFRGVLLGVLLSLGLPDWVAVIFAAAVYAGAVRASAGGRGLLLLLVSLGIGLAGGLVVLMTAGIAAAFVGHAITRFAFFMTMGDRVPAAAPMPSESGETVRTFVIPPRGHRGRR